MGMQTVGLPKKKPPELELIVIMEFSKSSLLNDTRNLVSVDKLHWENKGGAF